MGLNTSTMLVTIGDPMSESNIQRRLQWLRERVTDHDVHFSQAEIDRDPALQQALLELPWLKAQVRPKQP